MEENIPFHHLIKHELDKEKKIENYLASQEIQNFKHKREDINMFFYDSEHQAV